MTATNNAKQNGGAFRVALIADAEGARRVSAAMADSALQIVAQSGMPQAARLPGIDWHDDARVVITQVGVQALVLATSTRAAIELDRMAADNRVPVWRLPPLARNFAEATEIVAYVKQAKASFRVASWWESVADEVYAVAQHDESFKPVFTSIRISAAGPPVQSWRATQADAGGGVLTSDAYGLLEALVATRGLPERVFASIARLRRRPGEPPRETEDVAAAILHYEGGGSAVIRATWDIPPFGQLLEHHGPESSVMLGPDRVAIRTRDGEVLEQRELSAASFVPDEMARLAATLRAPQNRTGQAENLERHIAVTALLQAIYLSARTGQPESPRKLYEVQGWSEPQW